MDKLAGRETLFGRLDAELARARRSRANLGVVHCRFEGTADMAAIETGLKDCCREYDFAAISGEDVIVVLPGCGAADGWRIRERIQKIVRDAGAKVRVGAAFFPEDGADTEDLLTSADADLRAHV